MRRALLERAALISRILAAIAGGYALAYALAACVSLILPMARSEAVLTASMLSFAVYTAAVIWAFSAKTAKRAWIGVLAPAAICAAIASVFSQL